MSRYDDAYNLSKLIREIETDIGNSNVYLLDDYFEKNRQKKTVCSNRERSCNERFPGLIHKIHSHFLHNLYAISLFILLSGII